MTAEDPDAGAFLPSLTQLRAFHEAASLASISRASEELRRSQSAVTQAIQRLEEDLGEPLFVRTSTGSYLTEAGQILFQRASNCFSRIETAILALRDDLGQADPQLAAVARRVTRSQVRSLTAVHEYGSFAPSGAPRAGVADLAAAFGAHARKAAGPAALQQYRLRHQD